MAAEDTGVVHTGVVTAIEDALTRFLSIANLPKAHARFSEESGASIDKSAYVTLARLGEAGALRLSELAYVMGVDASTASRHVHSLERSGFVHRQPDPSDQRAARIVLTGAGRGLLARVRAAKCASLEALLAGWCDDDKRTFAALLDRFVVDLTTLLHTEPGGEARGHGHSSTEPLRHLAKDAR